MHGSSNNYGSELKNENENIPILFFCYNNSFFLQNYSLTSSLKDIISTLPKIILYYIY